MEMSGQPTANTAIHTPYCSASVSNFKKCITSCSQQCLLRLGQLNGLEAPANPGVHGSAAAAGLVWRVVEVLSLLEASDADLLHVSRGPLPRGHRDGDRPH